MGDDSTYRIVQIKAYGDLTIAASALGRVPIESQQRVGLVISPHLQELAAVLSPGCAIEVLALTETGIPALFDPTPRWRHDKWWSTIVLRRALARAAPGATLVMRHLGPVHRRILGRRVAIALPDAHNIYEAYDRFLTTALGPFTFATSVVSQAREARIAICPYSRVQSKCLPNAVLEVIAACCRSAGLSAEVILLDGEQAPPARLLPSRVIPRRFGALSDALAASAAVVSADSLPAHLAEYHGTPVFVVSPHANEYWLPSSAFRNGAWGVFGELEALAERLPQFFSRHF